MDADDTTATQNETQRSAKLIFRRDVSAPIAIPVLANVSRRYIVAWFNCLPGRASRHSWVYLEELVMRRPAARSAGSAAEVDQFDFADGTAEEAGAKALEFFYGVGGEAADFGLSCILSHP